MQLLYEYGFSVDADTKRIYLNAGVVTGFNQSVPQGADGVTKGMDTGAIISRTSKVGLNANSNLVYFDLKGKPYTGKITYKNSLPFDDQGRLLVDTVGAVTEYARGLGFTNLGVLAMDPVEVIKPGVCVLKSADAVAVNRVNVEFSDPKTGTRPFEFVGKAVGGGKVITGPLDEVAVKGSYFGALQGLTGGTDYQITVFAKNDAGNGDESNVISVRTPDGQPVAPGAIDYFSAYGSSSNRINVSFKEPTGTKPFSYVGVATDALGKMVSGPIYPIKGQADLWWGDLFGVAGGKTWKIYMYAENSVGKGENSRIVETYVPEGDAPPKVLIEKIEELDKAIYVVYDAQKPVPNEGYWVNIDGKEDRKLTSEPNAEGFLKSTITGLVNDQTYKMYLYAKNDGRSGEKSDVFEVTPTAPSKPNRPVITSLRNDPLYIYIEFAPTDDFGMADSGPLDLTGWEVYCSVNNGEPEVYKINDGAARSYKFVYANKDGDILQIWVRSFNEVGVSDPSTRSTLTVGEVHLIDGGNRSSDGTRQFVVFQKSADVIVNYDCRFDVFMVGGGGGGRGQLVPYGMGGNGGGGENQVAYYEFLKQGVYPVTIGGGAEYGGSQPGGDTKFPAILMTAKGGGTAQGKADGTPSTPKTKVPAGFEKCPDFAWNIGVSDYVSGYMEWDKNSQPNGKLFGQGGGGTNGTSGISRAGNGQDGIIVISYPLPPLLPINIQATKQAARTLSVIFNNPTVRVPSKWIVQPYINDQMVVNKGKVDNTTVFLFLLDGSSQSIAVKEGDKVYARIYPDGYGYYAQTETIIW